MNSKKTTYYSYGNTFKSTAEIFFPSSVAEVKEIIELCKENDRKITLAGSFNSFDRQNSGNDVVISFKEFNKIRYNKEEHSLTVGAGAEWGEILATAYEHKCILYTCITGTKPSAGGTLSVHAHSMWAPGVGKDGTYCLSFKIITPKGELLTCSRQENTDLFYGAISGFGMLGFIVEITYQVFHVGTHFEIDISTQTYHDIEKIEERLDLRKPSEFNQMEDIKSQSTLFYHEKGQAKFCVFNRQYKAVKKKTKSSKFRFYNAVIANGFIRLLPNLANNVLIKDSYRPVEKKWLLQGLKSYKPGTFWADPDYYWTKYMSRLLRPFGYKTHLYQMTHFIPFGGDKVTTFTKKVYELLDKYKLKYCMFDVMYIPKDEPFILSASRYTDGFYVNTTFMDYVKKDTLMSFYDELNSMCYDMKGKIYLAKNCFIKSDLLEEMHRTEIEEFVQLKQKYDPDNLLVSNFFKAHFPSYFGQEA